jgi:acyl-CoA thioesterase I
MNLQPYGRFLSIALLLIVCGCASLSKSKVHQQIGDSVVLVGQEPARLAFTPIATDAITLRSTYLPGPETVQFQAGRDYVFDRKAGTLARTPDSRIPDFRTNMLFGRLEFDHNQFPGFGNGRFFVFAEYAYVKQAPWPVQLPQAQFLSATLEKLRSGQPLRIVAFGDSITAGGDATQPGLIYWQRWADYLQRKYPRSTITAINGATGGDSTVQGLQRFQAKVLDANPDLVLVGFGMNDHNRGGVPVPQFEQNLREIITRIRQAKAEPVLVSTFPPNPKWKYGSHSMGEYAAATERVAASTDCAYADVYRNWEAVAARKKPEDLLGNNINHPNDFGHWIYFQVLSQIGI